MKISQLMIAKGFGGAERYFVDLSLALADQGHQVQAICHKQFTGRTKLDNKSNVQLQIFRLAGWWDVIARNRIEKAIVAFAPDIIHAHLARGAYIAGKISRHIGTPLVVKTHNYVKLKYYKHVDIFLPTTIDQQKYLIEKGIKLENIRMIPNFSSITPATELTKISDDQPRIICARGRMVRKKGFDILIKAIKKVTEQGLDIILYLGGDGPERDKLQQLCSDLGLDKKVIFTGWVDNVCGFLRDATLFVLPSFDEPFGIVVLEAMSQGKAIISTPTQGPCEILDDQTAWFAETGNVDSLANSMITAMNNKDMRMYKAQNALDKFKSSYSQAQVVPKIVRVYQELV
jgi:glycosyltransferase involved in cell wall biosynthesis